MSYFGKWLAAVAAMAGAVWSTTNLSGVKSTPPVDKTVTAPANTTPGDLMNR